MKQILIFFGLALLLFVVSCRNTTDSGSSDQNETKSDTSYIGVDVPFYNETVPVLDPVNYIKGIKAKAMDTIFIWRPIDAKHTGSWAVFSGSTPWTLEGMHEGMELRKGVLVTLIYFKKE